MSTRYTDPTWIECPSCRSVVPATAAFCPECGNRLDARGGHEDDYEPRRYAPERRYPPEPERRTPPWLPIVLGFGGAAILGIAVLLFILLTRDDPAVADATATPIPSASAATSTEASASAEPSEEPTPTSSPSPTPRPALGNRSVATVQNDGVELRTQPAGGELIGTLGAGSRVFIIGTPQDASERWYRVAYVSGPYSECGPGFCPTDIGYLPDGASDEDANLLAVSLDCPSSPMTAADLDLLHPLERLTCYGGNPIVVTGTLNYCYCDGPIQVTYSPPWLAAPVSQFLFDGTAALWLRFEDPPDDPEDLTAGDIVRVTVAMEHEDAPGCSVGGPPGAEIGSKASVVLYCRTQLVAEDYEVIGHDDAIAP